MKIVFLFLALAVGTISQAVCADDDDPGFEQIREWVKAGRILPLQQILDRYQPRYNGRLLDLEVEHEDDRIIYELEILQGDGQVIELKVDASTGRLLKREIAD